METLSGKTTLAEIDKVLTRARGLLAGVSSEFVSARDRMSRLRQQEIGIFARLARLRLLALEQGTLVDELEKADREVAGILVERERASSDLDDRIRAAEAALAASETRRADQQAIVAAAGDALDAAEAKAQGALETDEAWQRQLDRTERADFIAHQSEEKAAAARNDRIAKGAPYEHDPLFSYLWERGYGTSTYRAIPVTRWLDGMVARLCDYESARQNYSLLIEIPIRLGEHAERMRAELDREAAALAEIEGAAAAAAGVPELGDRLEEAENNLGAIDERIVEHENALRALIADRKRFASGDDEYYRNCLDVLGNAMRQKGLPLLEAEAARTATAEDNELVQQLALVKTELADIEQDLAEYRRLYDRENERVGGLEDVRRRFKARHYDDALSEFINGALITLVLNQFLSGTAQSGDVWKTIKRQQRTRQVHANPNFGTLRFPRAGKHGPWRMPGGFGRGGGFGGGGFRTGGGFRGGGGFKTGGGF